MLAEIFLWPITHQIHNSSQMGRDIPISDLTAKNFTTISATKSESQLAYSSWPVFVFIRPTPVLLDGLWLVTFYITYNDTKVGQGKSTALCSRLLQILLD